MAPSRDASVLTLVAERLSSLAGNSRPMRSRAWRGPAPFSMPAFPFISSTASVCSLQRAGPTAQVLIRWPNFLRLPLLSSKDSFLQLDLALDGRIEFVVIITVFCYACSSSRQASVEAGMDSTATDHDVWEEKLHNPTASPISLPYWFLKDITGNFSTEQELGRGGFGVVYKGVLRSSQIIAVKQLLDSNLVNDDVFQKEVTNVMGIKHKNIVQLVGYCSETRCEAIKLPNGINVMAEKRKRLLCFEYLPNKSLDKYIYDESAGLDWNQRYEIIKGICSGLHFLHQECHIVHLDLKPENILMDDTMRPKIADFGLSKLLGAQKSQTIINGDIAGSRGYMAPEYMLQGVVSPMADMFSLGVIIIEIITGRKNYPLSTVSYFQQFNSNNHRPNTELCREQYTEDIRTI
ncbi:hypothetical protein EJB05_28620, partial [Eragrostis curvula]